MFAPPRCRSNTGSPRRQRYMPPLPAAMTFYACRRLRDAFIRLPPSRAKFIYHAEASRYAILFDYCAVFLRPAFIRTPSLTTPRAMFVVRRPPAWSHMPYAATPVIHYFTPSARIRRHATHHLSFYATSPRHVVCRGESFTRTIANTRVTITPLRHSLRRLSPSFTITLPLLHYLLLPHY